jgi:hypothetical protein
LFIVTYLLILIFYKYNLILPNFINFNLINLTTLIFSITTSGIILEKNLIEFLINLNRVNYNNINFNQNELKFQEKYFSKYEGTYFSDKKCSESWVLNYYIPSEYLFKGNKIENFFLNFKNKSTFSLLGYFNNKLELNVESTVLSNKSPLNLQSPLSEVQTIS